MPARLSIDLLDEKLVNDFKEFVRFKHNGRFKGYYQEEIVNALITQMAFHNFKDYREKAIIMGLWPTVFDRKIKISRTGFVYFISDGDCVKIGFSTNPENRLNTLQVGSSKALELLYKIQCREKDERVIQNLFSDYHERGEWHRLEGKLKGFLEDLISSNQQDEKNVEGDLIERNGE